MYQGVYSIESNNKQLENMLMYRKWGKFKNYVMFIIWNNMNALKLCFKNTDMEESMWFKTLSYDIILNILHIYSEL